MKQDIDIVKMFQLACQARENAYAPYSKFAVGSCVWADDGNYYLGGNVENACYALGACSEVTAIGNMVVNGPRKIRAIMVVTDTTDPIPPCGGCLQKISEFADEDTEVICQTLTGKMAHHPFSEFFPIIFNKTSLQSHR